MKRFTVCIMVFLLMLWFSGNSVYAKPPNRLQVISAAADMTADNPKIIINALNFGDEPRVSLGNYPLEVTNSSNDQIEAIYEEDIPPGTYRLSVARSGFDFSHPEKADSLDVTISDVGSSGILEQINIYEITGLGMPTDSDPIITATCECEDGNDIAINGGFKIIGPIINDIYPELTIMESKIHRDDDKDFYQVRVKNHSDELVVGIEANVICIDVPDVP